MRHKRESQKRSLPWPVAPLPRVPEMSAETDLETVVLLLGDWWVELAGWLVIWHRRDSLFFRRLPEIEKQIRMLLDSTERYLPEKVPLKYGFTKRGTLASYHYLLALCLAAFRGGRHTETVQEFKTARSLAPDHSKYWYEYVRYLVCYGAVHEALDEINAVEIGLVERDQESIAHQILNWALIHPELAYGIRPDILKHCVGLASKDGSAILVLGTPQKRKSGEKWSRAEIMQILWLSLQRSVPVDELCMRIGIDQSTFFRWRNRYLPKEWDSR